jgi:hypothetical protein
MWWTNNNININNKINNTLIMWHNYNNMKEQCKGTTEENNIKET